MLNRTGAFKGKHIEYLHVDQLVEKLRMNCKFSILKPNKKAICFKNIDLVFFHLSIISPKHLQPGLAKRTTGDEPHLMQ